ncbi:MAG TPA: ATP-binding protein [Bacteroidota bacterium]|nr:ATP-binding protein [Bacteroidota bacterium]
MMRREFAREMASLDAVFEFLHRFAAEERLDPQAAYALDLAVEEFFTNIVKYGKGSAGGVLVEADRSGGTVTVRLEEETPVPFDVTRQTATQFDTPFAERKPGGLGIHIAREMLDGLTYDYVDGTSRITLTKHLEP